MTREDAIEKFKEPLTLKQLIKNIRKAWKPCDACFSCHTCTHRNDELLDSRYCWNCENGKQWKAGVMFCPYCGRPTIDEAWDELEKRLEE